VLTYQAKPLFSDKNLRIPVEAKWELSELSELSDGLSSYPVLEPLTVSGVLFNPGPDANGKERICFDGTARTVLQMSCDRCLERVDVSLETPVNASFVRQNGVETEITFDNMDEVPLEGDEIPLEEVILSDVSLSIPMKVLCKEDCKGLCPVCGKDLNFGACDCEEDNLDPRWDALKSLF